MSAHVAIAIVAAILTSARTVRIVAFIATSSKPTASNNVTKEIT